MHRRLRTKARRERGQILMLTALLLPILLGFSALAVDVGAYYAERRTLQNNADSIALAAGHGLPSTSAVNLLASQWAAKNNVATSDYTVTVVTSGSTPTVRVTVNRSHRFAFMRVLGISTKPVGAVAAAQKLAPATGRGVVPWSVTQQTADAATSGSIVTIKYDSHGNYGQGNFGAIRIDGNGASDYETSAKYGATSQVCSTRDANCDPTDCPGSYPSTCGENAPECDGYECTPKTGNMTGPTRDAVDFRKGYTSAACDTFAEAFTTVSAYAPSQSLERYVVAGGGGISAPQAPQYIVVPEHHGQGSHPTYTPTATWTPSRTPTWTSTPTFTHTPTRTPTPAATNTPTSTNTAGPSATPTRTNTNTPGPSPTPTHTSTPGPTNTPGSGGGSTYGLNPACNPWSGGACAPAPSTALCSRRIFLIPIVSSFGNGSSDPVQVTGFALVFLEGYTGGCSGSSCDIQARFVRADVSTGAFTGAYDPNSGLQYVRLTE